MFCPKCGALLVPKMVDGKPVKQCSCGYSSAGTSLKMKEESKNHEIHIIDSEKETLPISNDVECEKCGNKSAYFWLKQTRAGDEPETQFFKCTKCKNQWREY